VTDACGFGENYGDGADDENGTEVILVTLAGYLRDKESLSRLESIADRLAVATMALAGVLGDNRRSLLDISDELRDAQNALDDFARYGEELAAEAEFGGKRE
jgi:hypothetical protein